MKTALVTGAARGIGLATARRFFRAAFRVLALDKDFSGLDDHELERVDFDLTRTAEIPALIQRLGDIHVLVNNAGTLYCDPLGAIPRRTRRKSSRSTCARRWR